MTTESQKDANSEIDKNSIESVSVKRKLLGIHEVERYCRPHHLNLYNPVDSGFKYNVIGLFGIPD